MAIKRVRPWAKGQRVLWWEFRYAPNGPGGLGDLSRMAWKKLSARLKTLRGNKCEVCKTTASELKRVPDQYLELHHRYYIEGKRAWDYPPDAFWVLCPSCHGMLRRISGLRSDSVTLGDICRERAKEGKGCL